MARRIVCGNKQDPDVHYELDELEKEEAEDAAKKEKLDAQMKRDFEMYFGGISRPDDPLDFGLFDDDLDCDVAADVLSELLYPCQ